MRSRDHLSYGIAQCYLPPGKGDSPNFILVFTSTHFTVPQNVEGRVNLSKGAQPMPKAVYRSGCCDKHRAMVGFNPGTSHIAVKHLTTRPL